MAAPTKAKKKHARKAEKQYTMCEFESKIFDGTFNLPSPNHFPISVMNAARRNDLNPLIDFLRKAGTSEEDIEAIESLEGDEVEDFMGEWGEAAKVSVPK